MTYNLLNIWREGRTLEFRYGHSFWVKGRNIYNIVNLDAKIRHIIRFVLKN